MNLSPEINHKLRNLDPDELQKVSGFFDLLDTGDKLAVEIWSMANNKDIEPRKVADLIYDYMTYRSKPNTTDENSDAPGPDFHFKPV